MRHAKESVEATRTELLEALKRVQTASCVNARNGQISHARVYKEAGISDTTYYRPHYKDIRLAVQRVIEASRSTSANARGRAEGADGPNVESEAVVQARRIEYLRLQLAAAHSKILGLVEERDAARSEAQAYLVALKEQKHLVKEQRRLQHFRVISGTKAP